MNSYDINYDDKRFKDVESDKQEALSELAKTYSGVIRDTDRYYQAQTDASKEWADEQARLQKENTDFAVEKIEQQKEQARKDYTKEQAGAYLDWQKQSNRYGINAEQLAAAGMSGTGYSESSQVSMYNTYQNRVATARESYNQAVQNYNNSITEARLQNSSVLAEIAYQALQQQLELSLAGFQYKNQLILDQANRKTELDNIYYQRYQDVLDQINAENSLAESKRQFDLELKEEKRQFNAKYGTAQINNFANAGSAGAAGGISGVIPKIDKGNDDDADGGSGSDSGWMTRGEVGPWSDEYIKSMINRGELEEATINGVKMYRKTNSGKTIPASLITGKTQDKSQNADDILNSFFDSIFQSETGKNYKNTSGAALTPNPPKGNSGGDGTYTEETYNSIRSLGYGDITPEQLFKLCSLGLVQEYTKNGVQKFRSVSPEAYSPETMKSTVDLGYGNISFAEALKLVYYGELELYHDKGVVKFKKASGKTGSYSGAGKYYSKKNGGFGGKDTNVSVN